MKQHSTDGGSTTGNGGGCGLSDTIYNIQEPKMNNLSSGFRAVILSICAVTLLGIFGTSTIHAQTAGRSNVDKAETAAAESNKRFAPRYYLDDLTLIYGTEYHAAEVELRWGPSYDTAETAVGPAIVPNVEAKKWGPSYAEDDPALIGIYPSRETYSNQ